jgi:TonB family protein
VQAALVAESSSYSRLDRAALQAVKKAAFTPATEYGMPVESHTKVAYRFQLK